MKKVKKPEPIMVHIKAESPVFSCSEIVEESKAVKRLEELRNNFLLLKSHYKMSDAKLVVKTGVLNPTLFAVKKKAA